MNTLALLFALAVGQPLGPGGSYGIMETCGPSGCTYSGNVHLLDDVLLIYGDDTDYWMVYNSTSTQWELWSTDCDGGGTNCEVIVIDDGTDNVDFAGNITAVDEIAISDITTPGDAAGAGNLYFTAEDDATNRHNFCTIAMDVTDASSGAEYGDCVVSATTNGTDATEYLRVDSSSGTVALATGIPLQGNAGVGTKLQLDGTFDTNPLADGDICFGNNAKTQGVCLSSSALAGTLYVYKEDNSTIAGISGGKITAFGQIDGRSTIETKLAAGGQILITDTTATGDANGAGYIYFQADDSASNQHMMGTIELDVTDATSGAEYADLVLSATTNGTDATEYLRVDASAGGTVFNSTGGTIVGGAADDQIIFQETGSAADNICLKWVNDAWQFRQGDCTTYATSYAGTFTAYSVLSVQTGSAPKTQLYDVTSPGDANGEGYYDFLAQDDASNLHTMGQIALDVTDATSGTEDADIAFYAATDGIDDTEYLRFDASDEEVQFSKPSAQEFLGGDTKGAKTTGTGAYDDLTCTNDASLTTSGLIPDGAYLIGVTARVTTALTGPTDWDAGDGGTVNLYADAAATTQGTTIDNSDATANWTNPQIAAGEVTATFNGGNCTAGVIRVVAHYFTVTAPTSN